VTSKYSSRTTVYEGELMERLPGDSETAGEIYEVFLLNFQTMYDQAYRITLTPSLKLACLHQIFSPSGFQIKKTFSLRLVFMRIFHSV
jgi:hypothetical protein